MRLIRCLSSQTVLAMAAVACCLVCMPPCGAATIVLKNGESLQGTIIREDGDTIEVRLEFGTITLRQGEVETIIRGFGEAEDAAVPDASAEEAAGHASSDLFGPLEDGQPHSPPGIPGEPEKSEEQDSRDPAGMDSFSPGGGERGPHAAERTPPSRQKRAFGSTAHDFSSNGVDLDKARGVVKLLGMFGIAGFFMMIPLVLALDALFLWLGMKLIHANEKYSKCLVIAFLDIAFSLGVNMFFLIVSMDKTPIIQWISRVLAFAVSKMLAIKFMTDLGFSDAFKAAVLAFVLIALPGVVVAAALGLSVFNAGP